VIGVAKSVREGFSDRFNMALTDSEYRDASNKELGALFGVTAQAVRKWREGESMPTAEHAPRVAEVLGVRRSWLIDNELPIRPKLVNSAERGSGYATDDIGVTREEHKLLSDYRGLPHSLRTQLEQLADAMKRELKRR
jgi:transcriptional regulator with XRE-family HTH domain